MYMFNGSLLVECLPEDAQKGKAIASNVSGASPAPIQGAPAAGAATASTFYWIL